jgi:hypothetical protein
MRAASLPRAAFFAVRRLLRRRQQRAEPDQPFPEVADAIHPCLTSSGDDGDDCNDTAAPRAARGGDHDGTDSRVRRL